MKRLTKVFAETTHGTKGYEAVNKINTDTESIHNLSEIITTLGELEDVLESWHIENLEELKTRLHDCQVYHLQNNSNETLIHNLKNELAELKQKAIEPKFKIGQEVWFVSDPYTARYAKVRHMKIEEISISSIFVERGVMYAGDDWAGISESELFDTKEEAEQKLAEIGGKDEQL